MLEKILVFDTETTGFRSDDEVLTLAVVDGAGATVVDGMYAPVRKNAWPDAEKINRISPAMVVNCPPILAQQAELERMFNDPETLLVGYNIEFDIRLLAQSGIRIQNPNRHDVMLAFSEFRKVAGGNWRSAQTITAMTGGRRRRTERLQIRLRRSFAIRR